MEEDVLGMEDAPTEVKAEVKSEQEDEQPVGNAGGRVKRVANARQASSLMSPSKSPCSKKTERGFLSGCFQCNQSPLPRRQY